MKKNVILIIVDCLRANHLSCYGYSRKTSPFIDSLASKGMVFEDAFANAPFTAASFLSILSSVYPLEFEKQLPLPKDTTLISEILKRQGIRTIAIHSNPYLSGFYGYDRGWDHFEDFLHSCSTDTKRRRITDLKYIPKRMKKLLSIFMSFLGLELNEPYENAEIVTDYAIRWLNNKNPFFLWLHYMDLHEPYFLFKPKVRNKFSKNISRLSQIKAYINAILNRLSSKDIKTMKAIYDSKLFYIDNNLKKLFNFLKDNKLIKNTLIIITSDHGQEFLDHGRFGHRARFYDEILHIPLILFGQEINKERRKDLVSHIDLAPTILHFYDIPKPVEYRGDSLLLNHERNYVISEAAHNKIGQYIEDHRMFAPVFRTYAIRTKRWKFIFRKHINGKYKKEKCELYDLEKDSRELKNITHKQKGKIKEFRTKILNHIAGENRIITERQEKEKLKDKIRNLKSSGNI